MTEGGAHPAEPKEAGGIGYSIRIAKPNDAAGVDALLQASYPQLMAPAYDAVLLAPALELMTKANALLLASGTYYVAEAAEGAIVGCGGWTSQRPGTGEVESGLGHLRHFGTHPQWTRRAIGRAIYAACEASARLEGVTAFQCYSSLNAEEFYAALGFERLCKIDLALTPEVSLPGVLMRRIFVDAPAKGA